jgi:4-oxalocrotonate tautomerase
MFKGRSSEQKKEMVKEVTDAFIRSCGGNAKSVHVVITEVDKGDWGVGGELASELYPD